MADRLEEKKPEFKQCLIKQNWVLSDMKDHKWGTDGFGDITYGKITNGQLHNTRGIKINPKYGFVNIGYFVKYSGVTFPYVYCNADKFEIYEE